MCTNLLDIKFSETPFKVYMDERLLPKLPYRIEKKQTIYTVL